MGRSQVTIFEKFAIEAELMRWNRLIHSLQKSASDPAVGFALRIASGTSAPFTRIQYLRRSVLGDKH